MRIVSEYRANADASGVTLEVAKLGLGCDRSQIDDGSCTSSDTDAVWMIILES